MQKKRKRINIVECWMKTTTAKIENLFGQFKVMEPIRYSLWYGIGGFMQAKCKKHTHENNNNQIAVGWIPIFGGYFFSIWLVSCFFYFVFRIWWLCCRIQLIRFQSIFSMKMKETLKFVVFFFGINNKNICIKTK